MESSAVANTCAADVSFVEKIQECLNDKRIKLPVFDKIILQLHQELNKPESNITKIEKLIQNDLSLSGQLLKISNSCFYKGLCEINTINGAIVRLGVKEVSNIVILIAQKQNYSAKDAYIRQLMTSLWQHSVGVAFGSQWLAKECHFASRSHEAFLAGLLHDIGKLILLTIIDSKLLSDVKSYQSKETLIQDVLNSLHSEHGFLVVKNWNLPEQYLNVIRYHHLDKYDVKQFMITLVKLSDKMCNKLGFGLNVNSNMDLLSAPEIKLLGMSEMDLERLEIAIKDSKSLWI